ncbi:MAG: hypothetical protein HRT44_03950, partial [Bdellovibrionales bacterium]|nr:hypothetical protein [Bdellovibrionales bacterium]NQZ18396.1 hypothetical protein [Bdellovibrionales bacterium]
MKLLIRFMVVSLCFSGLSSTALASTTLNFNDFLNEYQTKSTRVLDAQQNLAQAERTQQSQTDYWQSRLSLNPELNFEERITESSPQIITPNRNQKFSATYTQTAPSGTTVELSGVEFIEQSNPLLSSLDSAYSAKITQDLSRNAFGLTQRSQARKANT